MNVLGTLLRRREEQLPTANAANKHSNRMQLYINCIVSVFYICTFASVSVFVKQQNASPFPHIATDCIHAWIAESVTKCATRLNLLGSQSINARILCKWRQDCTFHTQRIVRSQISQHSRRQVLKESKEWSAVAVNRSGTSPNQYLLFTPSFPGMILGSKCFQIYNKFQLQIFQKTKPATMMKIILLCFSVESNQ